jgi:large subunit ribosomal protein L4
MAKVNLYNMDGKTVGELALNDKVFGVEVKPTLIHEASVAQDHNARVAIAHTKTRGDVSGGGKKPWKQKGTGRARHGSTRSPIWVGGGVTFGPRKDRTFDIKVNKKVRRKAICMVLSDRVNDEHLVALDVIASEGGKTKTLAAAIKKLPGAGRSTLLIVDPKNTEVRRAAQNIPKVTTIDPQSLNVNDLLRNEYIMVSQKDIDVIASTYGK